MLESDLISKNFRLKKKKKSFKIYQDFYFKNILCMNKILPYYTFFLNLLRKFKYDFLMILVVFVLWGSVSGLFRKVPKPSDPQDLTFNFRILMYGHDKSVDRVHGSGLTFLSQNTSVADPFHLDMDPDPRIRFVK